MYKPLKITAWLASPVVSDATLPLDGVLYYYAMRRKYGPQDVTEPGGKQGDDPLRVDLPLLMLNKGPQWYYAASFAQWSIPVVESTDHWNKRFDTKYSDMVDFGGKRGKVIVEQGHYRAYHMPVFTRHSLEVTWYVVGDIAEIRTLLRFVTHLGKKTSQGYGEVLRFEIETHTEDWSVERSGMLMRAVPTGDDRHGFYCGYRPSYYVRHNMALCYVPNNDATQQCVGADVSTRGSTRAEVQASQE